MGMFINTNLAAINAQRNLGITGVKMSRALERLSSGLRINRAADDAAGLAISEKMRAQIRGLRQGIRNAQDAVSMVQTAEGSLNEVHAILQRMRELTVQAGNSTLSTDDRTAIGDELTTLRTEIDNIANRTTFNGLSLLTGALATSTTAGTITDVVDGTSGGVVSGTLDVSKADAGTSYTITAAGDDITITNDTTNVAQTITAVLMNNGDTQTLDFDAIGVVITLTHDGSANSVVADELAASIATNDDFSTDAGSTSAVFQVGPNNGDTITVAFDDTQTSSLGLSGSMAVADIAAADSLRTLVDTALTSVSSQRAKLGAAQNQVESAISSLGVAVENLSGAESRVRDADIAEISTELVTRQIMQQAGVAVLAQANTSAQSVLSLLQ